MTAPTQARSWAQEAGIWLPASAGVESREVSFSIALEWASPALAKHEGLPMFATPAWRDDEDQRRKTAAAVIAALDWALRAEAAAERRVAASHQISQAIDWRSEAQQAGYRSSPSYIPRRAA